MAARPRANAATLRDLHDTAWVVATARRPQVELAAGGVHPVGMISSHASVQLLLLLLLSLLLKYVNDKS